MEVRELRLGNWMKAKDTRTLPAFGKVVQTYAYGFSVDYHGFTVDNHYPGSYYEPIPLTPEILEKAGFELTNPLNIENANTYFKEGLNEFISYHGEGICIYESTKKRVIKYLHQLQNLYYALTGEELEISL